MVQDVMLRPLGTLCCLLMLGEFIHTQTSVGSITVDISLGALPTADAQLLCCFVLFALLT